jgi:hypothetical protein
VGKGQGSVSGGLRWVLRGRRSSDDGVGELQRTVHARRSGESEESEDDIRASGPGRASHWHGLAFIGRGRGEERSLGEERTAGGGSLVPLMVRRFPACNGKRRNGGEEKRTLVDAP